MLLKLGADFTGDVFTSRPLRRLDERSLGRLGELGSPMARKLREGSLGIGRFVSEGGLKKSTHDEAAIAQLLWSRCQSTPSFASEGEPAWGGDPRKRLSDHALCSVI